MKKFLRFSLLSILLGVMFLTLFACHNNLAGNNTDNNNFTNKLPTNSNEHSVKIDTEQKFDYYFSFSYKEDHDYHFDFGKINGNKGSYGTRTTSTITITPKLTGFVNYSGYVILSAEHKEGSVTKSEEVLKNRKIYIEYWGLATDIYTVNNTKEQNDDTISFSGIDYKFDSADIVITYHHDGLSGIPNLSYKSISITKYNYVGYLSLTIENNERRVATYNDNDYYHKNPIYVYYYWQTYDVKPVSEIHGEVEFNNIVLTFDNNFSLALDANGKASYRGINFITEQPIPKLTKIVGSIDFYPPATYEY